MADKASTLSHEVDDLGSVSQETWEELIGSNNWKGLLEPDLDLNLRKFILRCGDFCHAAYDAFTGDIGREVSIDDVNVPNARRYEIHNCLYAATHLSLIEKILHIPAVVCHHAAGDHIPNWMGYCAATTNEVSRAIGRREIYVVWRGTQRLFEWKNNLLFYKASAKCLLRSFDKKREGKKPKVMKGWRSIYTSIERAEKFRVKMSARDQLMDAVKVLLSRYKDEKINIVVTGHSLGGVLATLSAFDLAENIIGKDIPVTAVVFGCPKVGNEAFKRRVEQHTNLKILHIKNSKDIVPSVPPHKYVPLGSKLVIDTAKSPIPSLNNSGNNPGVWHDLEATLYMVAGWNGPKKEFKLQVDRGTKRLERPTKAFRYVKSEIELWTKRVTETLQKFI